MPHTGNNRTGPRWSRAGGVEVALGVPEAADQAPVQAGAGRAVVGGRVDEVPDELAGTHLVADLDDGIDGLVGGTQRVAAGSGVVDGDDGAAEEHAGVADGALAGGEDVLTGRAEEVDTAVTRLPALRRRFEAVNDHGTAGSGRQGEGPGPGAGGVVGVGIGVGISGRAGRAGRGGRVWRCRADRDQTRAGVRQSRDRDGQRGGEGGERQGSAEAHAARMARAGVVSRIRGAFEVLVGLSEALG